ncbi:response regulator transcription factor [Scytonema tolypothrichoides VB-61278]|nr:response regulator transcription factor [Scytonema tolypothrichoides VB-61278]
MPATTTILIVEDDVSLRETIQLYIEREGMHCLTANSGAESTAQIQRFRPDLIVLDIMLPDMDGFQICQQVRADGCFVPILMLTARANESDRIQGLAIGADDYLTKPFSAKELIARIKSLLRRAYSAGYRDVSCSSGLTVDRLKRQAFLNGKILDLRGKEFDLLEQLLTAPGRAYSREELLERVWGYDFEGDTRIVDVYIRKLREKIELNPTYPDYIQTVWGVGYRLKSGEK